MSKMPEKNDEDIGTINNGVWPRQGQRSASAPIKSLLYILKIEKGPFWVHCVQYSVTDGVKQERGFEWRKARSVNRLFKHFNKSIHIVP